MYTPLIETKLKEKQNNFDELLKVGKWACNLLEILAKKEAKEKNTTYKMCEYAALKALKQAIKKLEEK